MAGDSHACCDDIVDMKAWRDGYTQEAQRWRDGHAQENRDSFERFGKRMDTIEAKLDQALNRPTYAITVIITLMAGTIGVLVGIIGTLLSHFI